MSLAMRDLLKEWPGINDSDDDSDARLAINNSLNDLLHGLGISDEEAERLTGANRTELLRIYRTWAHRRGWSCTGLRQVPLRQRVMSRRC